MTREVYQAYAVTFDSAEAAEKVRRRLVDGGYEEDDVQLLDTERVKQGTSDDLRQLGPVMEALGSEGDRRTWTLGAS